MNDRWTVVRLKGGLGNQLFQYAFGLARAEAHGARLMLDSSWYQLQELRREGLTDALSNAPVADLAPQRRPEGIVVADAADLPGGETMYFVPERTFSFDLAMMTDRGASTYYEGYFQSWRYFSGLREQIVPAFALAEPTDWFRETVAALDPKSAIAVQVRLADYRTDAAARAVHGLLAPGYYAGALAAARKATGLERVLLFSDEPDVAMDTIPALDGAEVVQEPPGVHSMEAIHLMARCGARVLSNSSFGWWSGYLAADEATWGPSPWFEKKELDTASLILPAWGKIAAEWLGPED